MTLDGLRAQAQLYQHITIRDMPKRYVVLHFVLYGSCLAGFSIATPVIWALITAMEIVTSRVIGRAPDVANASALRVLGYLGNCALVGVLYYTPAVLLALQPDFGLYMLGLIWLFGTIAGATFMYHAMPAYFWASLLPGFAAVCTVLFLGLRTDFSHATVQSGFFAVGMLCIFIANKVQQLWDFRDTHEELDTTRSELLLRQRRLEHLSSHDGLTNLLNRAAFDVRLADAMRKARNGGSVAMFLLDLNRFKPINDTYGHDAGDAVIITVAERLAKIANSKGTVARMGGDEFAMIVTTKMGEAAMQSYGAAILSCISEPITYKTTVLQVSASLGIAYAGDSITQASEIYVAADQAMYRAKANGNGQVVVYHPKNFDPRPSLEDKYRFETALRTGEIRPYYQPKTCIESGQICGFEALARWEHPTRGILSPGQFLEDLQKLGMMPDLTYWMLRQVLTDISAWLAEGLDPGRVAVNIPEITLATQNGREDLDWLLAEFEQCRGHLTFEITEDVVIARSGGVITRAIEHFAQNDVAISLDDFGTGYASFQHLRQLTFEEMKIDTSFVAGLGTDPVADVIVEGFMLIARGLGVAVTAEGVETEAQLAHMRRLGCTMAQGFYFSPAVPQTEARAQLIRSASAAQSARTG